MKVNDILFSKQQPVNRSGGQPAKSLCQMLNRFRTASLAIAITLAGFALTAKADKLPISSATASADDGNVAANTLDGLLTTRWSASGDGQWIRFDLGKSATVGSVRIAWYKGDLRRSSFDVQTSDTGSIWNTVFTGQSSGTTAGFETFNVTSSAGRYVRIVGHGNSTDSWNSIGEVEAYDTGGVVVTGGSGLRVGLNRNGSTVTLNWNGTAGNISQVQVSSNLLSWANAGSPITNAGTTQTWQESVASLSPTAWRSRYYRVKQGTAPPPQQTNTPLPTIAKVYAKVQMGSKKMACYINRPIDQYDARVTRAIIVLHGAGANASAYFDRINDVIPSALSQKVMVIAPYFQGDGTTVPSGEWGWPDDDWREAGASGGISSFTVLDNFVELLRNHGTFPNLKWVIVTGHSAGGQTTQRFACFTDVDEKPWLNAQYMKFVVANPSSYVYLNQFRNPEGDSSWILPSQDCTDGNGYNEWKYGLVGLYGYTATRGAEWARSHLPARQVELLAGTADNFDNGDLDLDCAAMWQGPHRYARAHIFKMFMDKYYPVNNFRITDVPGVNHDSTAMYSSTQGKNALFFAD